MGKRKGPCIYISNLPRTTTRDLWRWIYRLHRVHQRELEKMSLDMMIYGTGFMSYPNGQDPKHVPFEQVKIDLGRRI